jgi:hypothetical protein
LIYENGDRTTNNMLYMSRCMAHSVWIHFVSIPQLASMSGLLMKPL